MERILTPVCGVYGRTIEEGFDGENKLQSRESGLQPMTSLGGLVGHRSGRNLSILG